jgi:hypothetical protein
VGGGSSKQRVRTTGDTDMREEPRRGGIELVGGWKLPQTVIVGERPQVGRAGIYALVVVVTNSLPAATKYEKKKKNERQNYQHRAR